MRHLHVISLFILLLSFQKIYSQDENLRLGFEQSLIVNKTINISTLNINTGFKPLLKSKISEQINLDSVIYNYNRETLFFQNHIRNWFYRKFFFEDFVSINEKDFTLSVNPLLFLEKGKDNISSTNPSINTRGIEIKGSIGKKIYFYSSFRENQAYFRQYIDSTVNERLIVPGQGAPKDFKNGGQDFAMATAYLSFSPFKNFNLQIGHDKHFIGEGYRSLLLSDNSFNYPFAKASFDYKGFKYTSLYTQFEDFVKVYFAYHTKKNGLFNYLSYSYKNIAEIGFFEGMIYQSTDSANLNKVPVNYFIPLIGLQTGIHGFEDNNNLLLGLNLKINPYHFTQIYGQIASDDPKNKKTAWQVGMKIFDVFFGKFNNNSLYIQAEYNSAENEIYKNTQRYTTWTHYNQDLAHPLGSQFSEKVIIAKYNLKNLFITGKYTTANTKGEYSDIFSAAIPENQNIKETIISHKSVMAGYLINPRYNFTIYGGADLRTKNTLREKYVFIGLSTDISNFYYDF